MPIETRRIMFNYDEIKEAVTSYGLKYNMSFPEGKLVKVTDANPKEYKFNPLQKAADALEGKKIPFIFSFVEDNNSAHKYINLNSEFVLGALIEYCLEHKIMMSKDMQKHIDVVEFGIALEISTKVEQVKTSLTSLTFDE